MSETMYDELFKGIIVAIKMQKPIKLQICGEWYTIDPKKLLEACVKEGQDA